MGVLIDITEKGWVPDPVIRGGIRHLLRKRLRQCQDTPKTRSGTNRRTIAIATQEANEQHYEVDPAFFRHVLGPQLKYSCCWYDTEDSSLESAEIAMLKLTCERAGLEDGMDILELGCGWGSLTLWMAAHYPNSMITAVSNSSRQRETIESLAAARGLENVTVKTDDINHFRPDQCFDRVVSVEMFEHVRNHVVLLDRIAQWLRPGGELFIHVFCHRHHSYTYENEGESDWMARHFFSGGMMPSYDYFSKLPSPFVTARQWKVNGMHYARTCRDWLARLDGQSDDAMALFRTDLDMKDAAVQLQRWRMFFMACEELFAWNSGDEWHVGHYRLVPSGGCQSGSGFTASDFMT